MKTISVHLFLLTQLFGTFKYPFFSSPWTSARIFEERSKVLASFISAQTVAKKSVRRARGLEISQDLNFMLGIQIWLQFTQLIKNISYQQTRQKLATFLENELCPNKIKVIKKRAVIKIGLLV